MSSFQDLEGFSFSITLMQKPKEVVIQRGMFFYTSIGFKYCVLFILYNFRAIFDAESLMPYLQYTFTHDISQDQDTQDQDQNKQDQDQDKQDQDQNTQDQDQDKQDQDRDKQDQVSHEDDYQGLGRKRDKCHKAEQEDIWQTLTGSF